MSSAKDTSLARQTPDEGWQGVVDFLSDWYWEQDENLCFTMMTGRRMRAHDTDSSPILGKTRWEQDRIWDLDDKGWEEHKATLYAQQPFSDFIYKITARNGELRYISVSGQPFFDEAGRFKGYRGIGKDVTREHRAELRSTIEHSVMKILATANSIADSAPQIIRTVCETLDWTCGAYWEHDETSNTLHCLQTWGTDSPEIEEFSRSRKSAARVKNGDQTLIGSAWAQADTVWISDITRDEDLSATAKAGLHSAFALPIKLGSQVTAVLEFYSHQIHQPDSELLECSAVIANQIAQFSQLISARERLQQSEERFRSLIELSSDWIWEQDETFRFTFFEGNQRLQHKADVKPSSRIGTQRWDMPALNLTDEDWARHKEQLERHEPFHDFLLRRPDVRGRERWMSISGLPIFDAQGKFKGYRGLAKDISERKLSELRVQHLATHDALTDLPNRALFSEILNRTILSSQRYKRKFAVLFIDLDRFKVINDSLGHDAGDLLLKIASKRLTHAVRTSDVVARLGGDEFVVLVQEVEAEHDVEIVAKKILSTLFRPVVLLGQECRVSGSIGICMYPTNALDEQSLMQNSDAAMYQAKEEGKNQYRFYSENVKSQSLERIALEASLRHAIERKQLFLQYQAKLDLKTKKISGVEALLRWKHPELGTVSPMQFIPMAEETGLIVPIGRWVLQTACAQNVAWQRAGFPSMCMAVNVSARQFSDEFLLEDIKAALDRTGMAPELLELELTESMVIQNPERGIQILKEIKKLGVRIAIDDFGTGYSSLAQLKNFPIDTLKVDRSFIRDIPSNREDNTMTMAIIAMGKSLGLTVVAEGVETEAQQTFLSDNACDETQGFYFSKPVDPKEFETLWINHSQVKPTEP